MYVVNLFGQPGAGKSTGAAYIFSKLKMAGLNVELVTEFAKDKTWEENQTALKNQAYMFGKQYYRISRCEDKVFMIITDSPLPLSIVYNQDKNLGFHFNQMVLNVFNSYKNLNYMIKKVKPYNPKGRNQTEAEASKLYGDIVNMLLSNNIPYKEYTGELESYDAIVEDIIKRIEKDK